MYSFSQIVKDAKRDISTQTFKPFTDCIYLYKEKLRLAEVRKIFIPNKEEKLRHEFLRLRVGVGTGRQS